MAKDDSHNYRLPTDEEWILGAGHMPNVVTMTGRSCGDGLTAVDAYSQTTGACGGIDFLGQLLGMDFIHGCKWTIYHQRRQLGF